MKKRLRKQLFLLTMCISAAGASTMAAVEGEDCFCTLTERSGFVAVVRSGEEHLTDIPESRLPAEDRKMLRTGIEVENREQLLLLLEDLGS